METTLEDSLLKLESYENVFKDLFVKMLDPEKTILYSFDQIAIAVMDRSLSVIFGFTSHIREENFICAGALLRLHLDSLLRFHAGFIVEDQKEFSMKVLKGERIDQMLDKNGKKMSDTYLSKELTKEYPWVKGIYERSSGFIHFSSEHIFQSSKLKENENIEHSISKKDRYIPMSMKEEVIDYMIKITKLLNNYIVQWISSKRDDMVIEK